MDVYFSKDEGKNKYIILVPTEIASIGYRIKEKKQHIVNMLKRLKDIFCCWLYSKKEFLEFFDKNDYKVIDKIPYHETVVYMLEGKC